jgi:hypothetical protein
MQWYWYPLIAVAAVFALYAVVVLTILIASRRGGLIEMPGGETIEPAPEGRAPGKRWRLTLERH